MSFPFVQAKPISYGAERSLAGVRYIVIHYTGNSGDTAAGNASFFHRHGDGNTRNAGAHFFIDQKGEVRQTIKLRYTAWAVGGDIVTRRGGGASLHLKCTNTNSVSIELCDCATKDPSPAMIKSVKKVISYIREYCPNANRTVRHFDVTGKSCPARMTGETAAGRKRWADFLRAIGETKKNTTVAKKTAPAYPTENLKYGAEGSQVKRLQRCLNKIDKAGLAIDGSYGPATRKAVKTFQKKHGLEVDGICGPKTRAKIREELEKKKK